MPKGGCGVGEENGQKGKENNLGRGDPGRGKSASVLVLARLRGSKGRGEKGKG